MLSIQLRTLDGRVLFFWKGKSSDIRSSSCFRLEVMFSDTTNNTIDAASTGYPQGTINLVVPEKMEEEWEKETNFLTALNHTENEDIQIYQTGNQRHSLFL